MKVIDFEKNNWFLYEHDGDLYFDGNYNHSFVGYDFMIKLDKTEIDNYKEQGRAFLNKLSHEINYSCPIHKDSNSKYKNRRVDNKLSELALDAYDNWRESIE